MGVHGLWELLAPVGRREPIETLYGKTVAIDISVWLTQFVRAMRDSEGAMLRNAHLLGIFRRCCKLLFHSIRPVFVFDGATPALKKRTLMLRAAARDRQEIKIRRLAEKLLRNRIKMDILEKSGGGGKKEGDNAETENKDSDRSGVEMVASKATGLSGKELIDDFADAALAAAEEAKIDVEKRKESFEEESDEIQPRDDGGDEIQPRSPGKMMEIVDDIEPCNPMGSTDEMPKKQVSNTGSAGDARGLQTKSSSASDPYANDFEPDDTAIDISEIPLDIDDETLAQVSSLPPSMHPELFRQLRQRQRLVNRQTILAHANKSNPLSFSEAQINAFLQSTSLNQKIYSARSAFQSKGGSARRIASDHRRAYLLEDLSEGVRTSGPLVDPIKRPRSSQRSPINSGIGWAERALQVRVPLSKNESEQNANKEGESSDDASMEWEDEVEVNKENQATLNVQKGSNSDGLYQLDGQKEANTVGIEDRTSKISKSQQQIPLVDSVPIVNPGREENVQTALKEASPQHEIEQVVFDNNEVPPGIDRAANAEVLTDLSQAVREAYHVEDELLEQKNTEAIADGMQENLVKTTNKKSVETRDLEPGSPSVSPDVTGQAARGEHPTEPTISNSISEIQDLNATISLDNDQEEEVEPEGNVNSKLHESKKVVKFANQVDEVGKQEGDFSSDAIAKDTPATAVDSLPSSVDGTKTTTQEVRAAAQNPSQSILDVQPTVEELSDAESPAVQEKKSRSRPEPETTMTPADAKKLKEEIEQENAKLRTEQSARMKSTTSVSSEMFQETRELLNLFGIPFVEAPGEAEAQCAYLNASGAVDAVITEDSDAFLFGAKTVYKRLFSSSTSHAASQGACEAYRTHQVAETLGIDKSGLIRLALLLGSDYTQGVRGVGIVNAMEVMHAFPGERGLEEFAEWFRNQPVTAVLPPELKRKKRSSKKRKRRKRSKKNLIPELVDTEDESENQNGEDNESSDMNVQEDRGIGSNEERLERKESLGADKKDEEGSDGEIGPERKTSPRDDLGVHKEKRIFEEKHKNVRRNWVVGDGFPSDVVIEAYEKPLVDKKVDNFEWQGVDYEGLGRFCWDKFGWTRDRFEQVIKDLKRSGTTTRRAPQIVRASDERFARIRSERLRRAVGGLGGTGGLERLGEFAKEKERDVSSWKVADLKKALKILQMPTSGKKRDLVGRLKVALGEDDAAEEY